MESPVITGNVSALVSDIATVSPKAKEILNVSDIRQYVYCPRIIYFNYVVPVPRHVTFKMQKGQTVHADFSAVEKRRTLAKYRLEEGTREFRVPLKSEKLGLIGNLDMLISGENGLYPVEFKSTFGSIGIHHKYQLVAYTMMVEEIRRRPVREGFVYLIPQKRIEKIVLDEGVRFYTKKLCTGIRNVITGGVFPQGTRRKGRCRDCEFRNYCMDM